MWVIKGNELCVVIGVKTLVKDVSVMSCLDSVGIVMHSEKFQLTIQARAITQTWMC